MACQGTRGARVPPIILLERSGAALEAETHVSILTCNLYTICSLFNLWKYLLTLYITGPVISNNKAFMRSILTLFVYKTTQALIWPVYIYSKDL